jgi:glycosyltransferase involved in cell wall biosynthesis
MHILITANSSWYILNFRGQLIRSLINAGHRITVLATQDGYTDRLRALGCAVEPLVMDTHGTSVLRELELLYTMIREFRRLRPDVVLSFTIKNNIYGALAARACGVPLVPNVSGLGPAFDKNGWLKTVVFVLYRFAFRHLPIVLFQNEDDRALFIQNGWVKEGRTRRLPGSGVDLDSFTVTPLPSGREIVFLLFARLINQKGVMEYVEAGKRLRDEGYPISCHILGFTDVDSRDAVGRERINAWIEEGAINYLGSSDDVREHISQADCVVLPSFYREGVPRSLLEAAAMGRPIVTTDVSGCRDVVDDEHTGYLCKARDIVSLAACMRRIAAMAPEERTEMGLKGRERIENLFDENIVISAYHDYINLLAENVEQASDS